jgi:hypothetical protein
MKACKRFTVTLLFIFLLCQAAFAAPATSTQAANVVKGWLNYSSSPFGKEAGTFLKIEAYGEDGITENLSEALYYAAYLDPAGVLLIPAEDSLEPITVFAPDMKWYGPEPKNPFYEVVGLNIAHMVKASRVSGRRSSGVDEARAKWTRLQELALYPDKRGAGGQLPNQPADEAVYLQGFTAQWDQAYNVSGDLNVYNEYTPYNFPAGCGAVMMAQIMKYFNHGYITEEASGREYTVKIDGVENPWPLRGGDGSGVLFEGKTYDWEHMPDQVSPTTTPEEARAIGALVADAAVAIGSEFAPNETGSYPERIADELVATFGYYSAMLAKAGPSGYVGQMDSETLIRAINSNIDSARPVGLGIHSSAGGGHGVVVHGYGTQAGTMYHHLNMGWGSPDGLNGAWDYWYNLPQILPNYDLVDSIIYNIYPTENPGRRGGKEIISGTVITSNDQRAEKTIVAITGGGISVTAETYAAAPGKFAFSQLPSNTKFTIVASLGGHTFPITEVTTGESASPTIYNNYVSRIGNVWNVIIQEDPLEGKGCGVAAFPAALLLVCVLVNRSRKKKLF